MARQIPASAGARPRPHRGSDPTGVRGGSLRAAGVTVDYFDLPPASIDPVRTPRWSESSKLVIRRAQRICVTRRDSQLEPMHLLLGRAGRQGGEQYRALLCSRGSTGPSLPGGRRGRCPDAYRDLVIEPYARSRGLVSSALCNLGTESDFRWPGGGYHRSTPTGVFVPTVAIVVEVLSPGEDLREVRLLCRAHAVAEIVIADPRRRRVECWQPSGKGHTQVSGSRLLEVTGAEVAAAILVAVRGSARSCLSDPGECGGSQVNADRLPTPDTVPPTGPQCREVWKTATGSSA